MEWSRGRFWLSAALLLPVLMFGQKHGLWRTDEVREVEMGREMALSGNWAVPTYDGEVFLEKPPLIYAFGRPGLWGRGPGLRKYRPSGFLLIRRAGRRGHGPARALPEPGAPGVGRGFDSGHRHPFLRARAPMLPDIALTAWVVLCFYSFYRVYPEKTNRTTAFSRCSPSTFSRSSPSIPRGLSAWSSRARRW